ncbi:hypothetical protein CICLE_v10023030mg [Citrus x clementina]|uniref:Uncharacterized protein n=1 Tax=Citrus clementina TaxID=85681 RepID=V4TTQ3_CITCL|nr:hypothetical protein CICLE_v10023030mg [Citrus x clementina]
MGTIKQYSITYITTLSKCKVQRKTSNQSSKDRVQRCLAKLPTDITTFLLLTFSFHSKFQNYDRVVNTICVHVISLAEWYLSMPIRIEWLITIFQTRIS